MLDPEREVAKLTDEQCRSILKVIIDKVMDVNVGNLPASEFQQSIENVLVAALIEFAPTLDSY
jgi:hypothetical protein